MIAVDTNVLVRYAMRDDLQQAEIARRFLAVNLGGAEGFSTFDKRFSNAVKWLGIQQKIYFLRLY